jgi:ZIP family zinc transporter
VHPTLTVLGFSALAAAAASLGVMPLLFRERPPMAWLGWSNALAAGLMLGAAYLLLSSGRGLGALPLSAGAALGIGLVYLTHAALGTADLELNRLGDAEQDYARKVILVHTLHALPEGVAIGVAMSLSAELGVFMALAIAAHNVPEGTLLAAILTSRGTSRARAAAAAVMTNLGQILLAVGTYVMLLASPGGVSWMLGFAAAALVYLVLAELLPECYRQAGHTSVAVVTILAMGMVALLGGGLG